LGLLLKRMWPLGREEAITIWWFKGSEEERNQMVEGDKVCDLMQRGEGQQKETEPQRPRNQNPSTKRN
jgi:hypothetical protein